jgi:hypothetical protein
MEKPSTRRRGVKGLTRRGALKKAKVVDLFAQADGTATAKGGAAIAREAAQPAVYQHNQTDLEFLR